MEAGQAVFSELKQEPVRLEQDQRRDGEPLPRKHELVFVFKVGNAGHTNTPSGSAIRANIRWSGSERGPISIAEHSLDLALVRAVAL